MDGDLLITADPERPEDAINQLASFRKLEYKQTATFAFLALPIFKKIYSSLPFTLPETIRKGKKIQLKKKLEKKHSKTTPSKVYGIAIPDGVASF
jgi:hypothetical protein